MVQEKRFDRLRRKSLDYSIKDGSAYSVMDSLGNGYIIPYAIALGANNSFIGFIASLPGLISSMFQIITPKLIERYARKTIITIFALLQAVMWLPIALLAVINFDFKYTLLALMVLYIISVSFNAAISPSWTSWMKDLVPEKEYGRFFGKRNKITGFIGLIAMIAAGFMLDLFKKINYVFIGFFILFLVSFLARLTSRHFLKKQYEPPLKLNKEYYFSFWQFIKKMPTNNFGRFAIYVALMQFAVNIASPFVTVYILKDLKFDYAMFTVLITIQAFATLITMPLWGRFSDKYGNISTLKIAGMLVPLVPLLWIFSRNFYYLTFVQTFAGIVWAGFNLAAANFIFSCTTRERISLCAAYSGILNTLGLFIGATMGGFLSTRINIGINSFFALFIISTVARYLVSVFFLPLVKEVREVKNFSVKDGIRDGLKHQVYNFMKMLRIPV